MTDDQLETFRSKLKKRLVELKERTKGRQEELLKAMENLPHLPDDLDHAKELADINAGLGVHGYDLSLQDQVQSALWKTEYGPYGFCDYCGLHIDLKRLDAQPWASLCINCQSIHELIGLPQSVPPASLMTQELERAA